MATPLSTDDFFVPTLKDPKTNTFFKYLVQIYSERKTPSGSYEAGIIVNLE